MLIGKPESVYMHVFSAFVIISHVSLLSSWLFQVPLEDLQEASEILIKALLIREKYMSASMQYFPPTAARFLRSVGEAAPPAPGPYPPLAEAERDASVYEGNYCFENDPR